MLFVSAVNSESFKIMCSGKDQVRREIPDIEAVKIIILILDILLELNACIQLSFLHIFSLQHI